ncbi:MAG: peroxiredoxin [Cyclobacteriaceae bacterium]
MYTLTKELAEPYQDGFDLHGYNGDSSDELPLAATYIINQKGVIIYAFLDAEYRNRAEPSDMIKVLKSLKTKS